MCDQISVKIRSTALTESTRAFQLSNKISNIAIPQIVISEIKESQLQPISKAQGDQDDLKPETDRQNFRRDMYKTPIMKGSKTHHIVFLDQISGQQLTQIKYFEKPPSIIEQIDDNDDECCPCKIF